MLRVVFDSATGLRSAVKERKIERKNDIEKEKKKERVSERGRERRERKRNREIEIGTGRETESERLEARETKKFYDTFTEREKRRQRQ